MKKYAEFNMPDSVEREIYPHEVLLSFFTDEDAAFFREWWLNVGRSRFGVWLNERPEDRE